MELRFCRVSLPGSRETTEDPGKVSAIYIREILPPDRAERIE